MKPVRHIQLVSDVVHISCALQVAAIISSTFYSSWFLLAGFIIPRPRIPGWWIW